MKLAYCCMNTFEILRIRNSQIVGALPLSGSCMNGCHRRQSGPHIVFAHLLRIEKCFHDLNSHTIAFSLSIRCKSTSIYSESTKKESSHREGKATPYSSTKYMNTYVVLGTPYSGVHISAAAHWLSTTPILWYGPTSFIFSLQLIMPAHACLLNVQSVVSMLYVVLPSHACVACDKYHAGIDAYLYALAVG